MNTKSINEAFERLSKKHSDAMAVYEQHIQEIEKKVPEIARLNSSLTNTSINIIKTALSGNEDIKSKVYEIKKNNEETQLRIAQLLQSKGYDKDYLDMKYYCPICCDTGFFNNDYCKCIQDLIRQINNESVNKISNLKLCTFEDFSLDYYDKNKLVSIHNNTATEYSIMKSNLENCQEYVKNFNLSNPVNILMLGNTGLGKTHLSLSVASGIIKKGYNVIYNSALDLFSMLEKEKFSKYGNSENDTLENLLNADLLIIDDLGVEYDSKFYTVVLYNIINTRYIRSLPTIINTNLTIDDLECKYEYRITSRLLTYEIMEFFGRDVRQQQTYNKKKFNRESFENNLNRQI